LEGHFVFVHLLLPQFHLLLLSDVNCFFSSTSRPASQGYHHHYHQQHHPDQLQLLQQAALTEIIAEATHHQHWWQECWYCRWLTYRCSSFLQCYPEVAQLLSLC
jgi:hypothetical protein